MWRRTGWLGLVLLGLVGAHAARASERGEELDLSRAGRLDESKLVAAVLARNPSVAAASEAQRAAAAAAPQARALDDPKLTLSAAPLSFFKSDVPDGYTVELEQMFPLGGKLGDRADRAAAEAEAAGADLEMVQQSLALEAVRLFDAWFDVHRALEINAAHQVLVRELKHSAEAEYATGRASQQDPLEAEVELAHLEHQAMVLATDREVIRAELDGLLHRAPDAELPPPPDALAATAAEPELATMMDLAVRSRPELAALRARLGGADAAVRLAQSSSWPDVGVMAQYNPMWAMPEHRWMVGVAVNLPLQLGRRRAAVDEAEAQRARLQREEARQLDDVRVDVQRAVLRLREAIGVARLYRTRLLPAARDEVNAARAGFVAGQNPFNTLVQAEKNLRDVELDALKAESSVDLQQAELDRAVGRVAGLSHQGPQP